jgi:hypothetical protein
LGGHAYSVNAIGRWPHSFCAEFKPLLPVHSEPLLGDRLLQSPAPARTKPSYVFSGPAPWEFDETSSFSDALYPRFHELQAFSGRFFT